MSDRPTAEGPEPEGGWDAYHEQWVAFGIADDERERKRRAAALQEPRP